VLFEVAKFVPLFVLYSIPGTAKQYMYAFSATLLCSITLRFGVIDEVSIVLLRESAFLKAAARRTLQCVTLMLLIVGVLLAVYAPGDERSKFIAGLSVVNRGAAMVQCGLLLSLLIFSRFMGMSWLRQAFGITLGFGVLTSVDLATSAVRAEVIGKAALEFLNLLVTGAYLVCVLIWIRYSLSPEIETGSLTVVSHDEVDTWNTELQHLVRDRSPLGL
jgi:hypothetical protein